MADATPSKGLKGQTLSFKLDTKEWMQDILKWELKPEKKDSDGQTFAEVNSGASVDFTLTVTAIMSTDAASFWTFCFDNAGLTKDFILAPHANTSPTTDQPHFIGKAKITLPPSMNDEANSGKRSVFDIDLTVEGGITKKTSSV